MTRCARQFIQERKLYHNYSMSPIPQKLIANYSTRGLAVPRVGDTSFVTGSIHGRCRSRLTYTVAHPGFGKGGGNSMARTKIKGWQGPKSKMAKMKQGPKSSFFTTDQRISAIKAQAWLNQWRGLKSSKPPSCPRSCCEPFDFIQSSSSLSFITGCI